MRQAGPRAGWRWVDGKEEGSQSVQGRILKLLVWMSRGQKYLGVSGCALRV